MSVSGISGYSSTYSKTEKERNYIVKGREKYEVGFK